LDDVRLRPDDLQRRQVLARDGIVADSDALAQAAALEAIAELQAALESHLQIGQLVKVAAVHASRWHRAAAVVTVLLERKRDPLVTAKAVRPSRCEHEPESQLAERNHVKMF